MKWAASSQGLTGALKLHIAANNVDNREFIFNLLNITHGRKIDDACPVAVRLKADVVSGSVIERRSFI